MFRLWTTSALIAMDVQAVIAMRRWGVAGLWHVSANENWRMIEEKLHAVRGGMIAASRAMFRGGDAVQVITKAAAPLRRNTCSNVTRLQKGNPLLPVKKGR